MYFDYISYFLLRLSMRGLERGAHLTRYSMYEALARVGENLSMKTGDVLSISHSKKLIEIMGLCPKKIHEGNYPYLDMLDLKYPNDSFDFVLSDQVLEHVAGDPAQAINESWRVLRQGGIAVHTSCFINPIHDAPGDYWRFTPEALKLLCSNFSKIISCDSWGNFLALRLIKNGFRFDGVPNACWHPFNKIAKENEPDWPIVTWIVAQK